MAGIYIHIPFCTRKCHYCNFFSLASKKLREPFLQALKTEIGLTRGYLAGEPVNTIYFGGGTPSVYRPGELEDLIPGLSPRGDPSPPDPSPGRGEGGRISPFAREITLEMNPEDVTEEYVEELRNTSFNRFSLGVQSFSDEDLASLNRPHSAGQALKAVKLLQRAGYGNISIDLIFGIQGSPDERWRKNLEIAFSLDVPHISAYALTVEPGTPLAWMIERRRREPVSDEAQVSQFRLLMAMSREQGYQQYEISNFAKPGRHAVHNTNYWNGVSYLGLGPSAHSYNGTARRWNVSSLSAYISSMGKGDHNYEEEFLTPVQKYNEYVMTSIRTMWGVEREKCEVKSEKFGKKIQEFSDLGWIWESGGRVMLTDEGKLMADRVAMELFL